MKQLYNASAYKRNKHFKCLLIEQIATAKTGCEKMEAILRKKNDYTSELWNDRVDIESHNHNNLEYQ